MRPTFYLFACILLAMSGTAAAQVTETASERFTQAAPDAGGQMVNIQNFGPSIYGDFDDLNDETLTVGSSTGIGVAEQYSSIEPLAYSAALAVSASAFPDFFDVVNGYGRAYYEVEFTVSSAVDFHIVGTANAFGDVNGETSDVLIRIVSLGGGSPTLTIIDLSDGGTSFDENGALLPGDYRLEADVLAIVSRSFDDAPGSASADAQFAMTFETAPMELRGDMNCSGEVDIDDVAPFVLVMLDPDGYDAAFPDCDKELADMNQDSFRNGSDIQLFVSEILGI